MLNSYEQSVYNAWLYTVRTQQGKPFRPRKKWDTLRCDVESCTVQVASFFKRHPNVDISCFFAAPYNVYTNDTSKRLYPMSFYIAHKAVSLYTTYLKMLKLSPPDSSQHLAWIERSWLFIVRYCIEHKIPLQDYGSSYNGALIAPFVQHIKDAKITIHVMFAFPDAFAYMQSMDPDLRNMMFGDIDIFDMRRDYLSSKIAKASCEKGYAVCQQFVQDKLSNNVSRKG